MTAIADHHLHADAHHEHHDAGFLKKYLFSTDHKVIGIQFLFVGLVFMVVGGLLAMAIRWQLAWPSDPAHPVPVLGTMLGWAQGVMPPDFYAMAFTMHASIMIFFVIIPLLVGTFGNYLIPLHIGARDMAFPFLNGFAFWSAFAAGSIMLAGFWLPGPPGAGWTSYPPLSALTFTDTSHAANLLRPAGSVWPMTPVVMNFLATFLACYFVCTHQIVFRSRAAGALLSLLLSAVAAVLLTRFTQLAAFDGQSAWFLSLILLGFSSLLGAVNYLSTVATMRAPGMTLFRMSLSVWSLLITSILVLLATPVLASALLMNLLDHHRLTSFFEPHNWVTSNVPANSAGGGYPLLHQHLFWFYSHPAVYIMILPAMGMVSDIISTFSRKPVFGYRPMIYALGAIAFLGFIVWGHHMFQSGMNPLLGTSFAVSTIFIAVPSAIKVFNWLGTLWGGNIRFTVPMLNALAFVSMFVIGGLSGIFMASTPVDVFITDTYFIVAHIHYVLFGGSMFGIFAALYYWYPKMFGRELNKTLGYVHFFVSFLSFNGTFFMMHVLGMRGMPRRYAGYLNYQSFADLQPMNIFITVCAFILGVGQIPFVINFLGSLLWGKRAEANPWEANTMEWTNAPSPPPHGNFGPTIPDVYHGPYEYSSPLTREDWLPQTKPLAGQTPATHGH
jgi:cytochrome c oxidase subunit 1